MSQQTPETPDWGGLTFASEEWPTVSIEQYGPDGSTVLGRVQFWACPSCAAMVPGGVDAPDLFRDRHRAWHEEMAEAARLANMNRVIG